MVIYMQCGAVIKEDERSSEMHAALTNTISRKVNKNKCS